MPVLILAAMNPQIEFVHINPLEKEGFLYKLLQNLLLLLFFDYLGT